MSDSINNRSKQILEAIIEDYISTAEPIGSRTICSRHGLPFSPATIRNIMSDLEEMGFLASPHTSAGRVPTEKAYRFYVDSLLAVGGVDKKEREKIRQHCTLTGKDVDRMFRDISRTLSSVSRYMGIVAAPSFTTNIFRHIEFINLGSNRILAILVSENGSVQNKIIESDQSFKSEELIRMANYLNGLLKGLSIAQVKKRVIIEMESDKSDYDRLLAGALRLSKQTISDSESEIFIEGQVNIMELPEFTDITRMKEIFSAFEEKGQLLSLLDRCITAPGVNIFIGSESHINIMSGMSLITSTFLSGKNTLGVLGVIGPTRMGYGKVIPIVDYTAKMLGKMLQSN
ncbi:MAG: heat-inducible transcriptional repressor HrcA [Desulfuromonadales bacterium]|nr:heat-inducible transcriptional repressor HrcA [Desulfuromonadales bacterium]